MLLAIKCSVSKEYHYANIKTYFIRSNSEVLQLITPIQNVFNIGIKSITTPACTSENKMGLKSVLIAFIFGHN